MSKVFYYYIFAFIFGISGLLIAYNESPAIAIAIFLQIWAANLQQGGNDLTHLESFRTKLKIAMEKRK